MITHKFRLYPNKQTENKLLETLEICRQGYNTFLGELNSQKVIDKSLIQGIIPDMKICDSRFEKAHSKALQYECCRLFSNLSSLAKLKKKGKKVGALRFKGKGWFKTFTYNQSGFKIKPTGKRLQTLWLSKIGSIPIRCHRNIKGKIKQITIKKEPSGRWFASVCEERKITIPKQPIRKIVGIDLGIIDIIYDSNGNSITNPRHLKQRENQLKHLQRQMSKKKLRSNNRNRWRIRLARQYERLTNTRNDFLHKLSRAYVNNFDAIGVEDMDVTRMVHGNLSKSILDAGWGQLRQYMAYKAENAGKLFIPVDYRGTTIRCSRCGADNPKGLSEREHNCWNCGFAVPRDFNSALEIKRLCLEKIRQELPESTHLEMEALQSNLQLPSVKNEAYSKTSVLV